jgi:hypothetical protein
MAGKRQSKSKLGLFSDLVTLASSGWTPEETGKILDRLEAMGDVNAPLPETITKLPEDDDIDLEDSGDDATINLSDDTDDVDSDDVDDNDTADIAENLDKMKTIGLEVENRRLKKEIEKMQQINRAKDISGAANEKSLEDSLIDAFQSCFN